MKTFAEHLKEYYITDDPGDITNAVSSYLFMMAEDMEEKEPYATKSINQLKQAAYEVFNIPID